MLWQFILAQISKGAASDDLFDKRKRVNLSIDYEDILRKYKEYKKIHHIGKSS